jgi:adenosine kinase
VNIIVTGSVAFDYLMQFPGHFRDHILPDRLDSLSLSFLVESMMRRRGGTASNIAYTLALLGVRARIMATVGEDFTEYGRWLETKGVDISLIRVIPDEFTASFFVNTDRSNAQIASFYPGAMAYASDLSIGEIDGARPDLVIISPNDPIAMCKYVEECRSLGIPYIYDPSQQIVRLDPVNLSAGVDSALGLCVNEYEYGLILNKLSRKADEGLSQEGFTVITRGQAGAEIYDHGRAFPIPIVYPTDIADPTGVGDAFRGGFLTGYLREWPLDLCGRMGALAATYCLESSGPQGHWYTTAEFIRRFRENFDDEGQLDTLLSPS